jgi:hypothetical protein
MPFKNAPQVLSNSGEATIRRYVHSPLAIEHNGIQAKIQSNGKIVLSKVAATDGDTVEYDEIEIPASLVFKLGSLLRATRRVEFVAISDSQHSSTPEELE